MLQWIPVFPLLGFLINGLIYLVSASSHAKNHHNSHGDSGHGHHDTIGLSAKASGTLASLMIGFSFLFSLFLFLKLQGMQESERFVEATLFSWMKFGSFSLDFAFRFDSLSALFCMVISGVGTLIHIYSIGYMSHDASPGKFFAYLNLFCAAMLVLVLGNSLPIMFLGWEGVGLCSYLLISFWYTDVEKAKAGKKAFIVNRVGDFGFILGMFTIFTLFGTLEFQEVYSKITLGGMGFDQAMITASCFFLFVGCMGKSAQIPLYIWLPDAMAGPTPVSALIHAATMVTSGIYLLARMNFYFILAPDAMMFIATIGALTALFAALIAILQTDIKKVLAYSTVSQLGYMFLACGVGAFGAGVFHVITHAFFKALLFLGSGSVIHGMHEEQDIQKMGGLKKYMPVTYGIFLVGWLAICGIPPFSGFFSKDEILWFAYAGENSNMFLYGVGVFTALLTAFYMTRLFVLTFLGEPRFKPGKSGVDVHESPLVMTIPLMILAGLSALGGLMGIPHMSWLHHWLQPILVQEVPLRADVSHTMEFVLMGVSATLAALSMWFGYKLYHKKSYDSVFQKNFPKLSLAMKNKFYIDEIFTALFVKPLEGLGNFFWKVMDVGMIDRLVLSTGLASLRSGEGLAKIQNGSIQVYTVLLGLGLILGMGYLVYGTF